MGRPPPEAVIFDWGGTLTPWHAVDFAEESRALAAAVAEADETAATLLAAAVQAVWTRSRDHHTSATLADVFAEAGLVHDESLLTAYRDFWAPHTYTDPDVPHLFGRLRADGGQGGRALQHRVAAVVARGALRPRRGAGARRRRGLHQRGALDQAGA